MQIVGRETRYHGVRSGDSMEEAIFTISEDGNIINEIAGQSKWTCYRQ